MADLHDAGRAECRAFFFHDRCAQRPFVQNCPVRDEFHHPVALKDFGGFDDAGVVDELIHGGVKHPGAQLHFPAVGADSAGV